MTYAQSRDAVLKMLGKVSMDDLDMFEMTIVSTPVTARTRRLRVNWVPEEEQVVQAEVDPSAEETIKQILEGLRR